jgi:hypothetical protein
LRPLGVKSHRIVSHVEWARESGRPSGLPTPKRLRGSRGIGVSYEKRFAQAIARSLPAARHGQWYEFSADGQRGFCQPDVVVPFSGAMLVLECKLKNIEQAERQLVQLYLPVLREAHKCDVRAIIVSRSLSALPSGSVVARSLLEALQLTRNGGMPVLHWLGRGPL